MFKPHAFVKRCHIHPGMICHAGFLFWKILHNNTITVTLHILFAFPFCTLYLIEMLYAHDIYILCTIFIHILHHIIYHSTYIYIIYHYIHTIYIYMISPSHWPMSDESPRSRELHSLTSWKSVRRRDRWYIFQAPDFQTKLNMYI